MARKDQGDKRESIGGIASSLNLQNYIVEDVINKYIVYLQNALSEGKTIKFLNICYLRCGSESFLNETLAYVAAEISPWCGVSPNVTLRVLFAYEEFIIEQLKESREFTIRGIVRISLEDFNSKKHGIVKRLRLRKSTVFNSEDVRVSAVSSFKRKLEVA